MNQLITFSNDSEHMQTISNSYYLKESFTHTFEHYKKYKLNMLDGYSNEILQEMEVLEILEALGFPMDEAGTILYKNMIIKAMHHLNGIDDFGNSISRDQLLEQMKKPFSQFYMEVARSDLDIGIKTFHAHVQQSIRNSSHTNSDTALLFDFYSNFSKNTDCGEAAFWIADYINSMKIAKEKIAVKQIVKKPGNMKFSN